MLDSHWKQITAWSLSKKALSNFVGPWGIVFAEANITQIKDKLYKYYGDYPLSISMVKNWLTEFRFGCTSKNDTECSGCPIEVATTDTNRSHSMVQWYRI